LELYTSGTCRRFLVWFMYSWNMLKLFDIHTHLENNKHGFFCLYGFGHVFCPLPIVTIFLKYGHVRLQSLYLQVNTFSVILDLPHWFRQYECLV
jgi:hypothetical protein